MFCANWRLSSGGKILSSKTHWAHGATVLSSVGKSQTDTWRKQPFICILSVWRTTQKQDTGIICKSICIPHIIFSNRRHEITNFSVLLKLREVQSIGLHLTKIMVKIVLTGNVSRVSHLFAVDMIFLGSDKARKGVQQRK